MQIETETTETHKTIATGIKRELPCKLTDSELLDTAIIKADLEAELTALENEFDEVKSDWSKRLKDTERRIEKLGAEIHARERKRVIDCHDRIEIATRMVETVREDTGEVVERRVANLFETGRVTPPAKHVNGDAVAAPGDEDDGAALDDAAEESKSGDIADAMKAQEDSGIVEDEDGDVAVPDTAAPKNGKRKGKK